jgi:hypothetical protein
MSITIKHTVFGFHVLIVSDDRGRFSNAIEALKITIPKRNRRYLPESRYWFIDKRKERKLHQWIDRIKEFGEVSIFEVKQNEILVAAEAL